MPALNTSPSGDNPGETDASGPDHALVAAFLDHLSNTHSSRSVRRYGAAARHFLVWLARSGTPIARVDESLVDRFTRHQCSCPSFGPHALQASDYIDRIRRFIRFLEDCGDIPVIHDLHDLPGHLIRFAAHLKVVGYSPGNQRGYRAEAEHLACWLRLSRIRWCDAGDIVLDRFIRHDCHCPIRRKRGALADRTGAAHRRRGAQRFICFLRKGGAIPPAPVIPGLPENPLLSEFRIWLKQHRGATDTTIQRYLGEVSRWLSTLGRDPAACDAATIRNVVLDHPPLGSRPSFRCLRK